MSVIGKSVPRLEDPVLLTGRGRFAADIAFAGQLHMRVLRSPAAHGVVRALDTRAAAALPGVHAVWTAADVAEIPPIDLRLAANRIQNLHLCLQPILAQAVVRYAGEPVAVVFADSASRAQDAAERIALDIEERPVLLDAVGPTGEFAPGVGSEPAVIEKGYGDLEAAFAAAAHVFAFELAVGRHTAVAMETRGAVVRWDEAAGRLEFHGAAKIPHLNRLALAKLLGIAPAKIHLFEGHVGGGFGVRGEIYPEDVLACLAALRFRRPVRWIEDRMENLMAANHSREQLHRVRVAVDGQGRVLGLDDDFYTDQGAYVRTHGGTVTDTTAGMLPGPYVVPAYRARGHIRLTNKTPAGTYRAPGRFEATFVCERVMDLVAEALGLDPLAVRRANLIGRDAMPFARGVEIGGSPVVYDSGDYPGLLDRFLDHVGYHALREAVAARRAAGELVGVGLGLFVEKSGQGPFDDVRIEMDGEGRVEVITGAASLGQGVATVMAQICADGLGIGCDAVAVVHGQTDRIERGMGSFASRTTVMTGTAVHQAAGKLKRRLVDTAAGLLQASAESLEIVDGTVRIAGSGAGPAVSLADAAAACLAEDGGERIAGEASFENTTMTCPYGAHLVVVAIDPDTAAVTVERVAVAYDVGRAVNPMLVEGQIAGGVAQGIGGALYEEFRYDAAGQPLAATFTDYAMPTAMEIPPVELLLLEEAPSTTNPLGLKGAGEGGINAMGAAIASALGEAIGRPGAITRLPVTRDRLFAILHGLPAD